MAGRVVGRVVVGTVVGATVVTGTTGVVVATAVCGGTVGGSVSSGPSSGPVARLVVKSSPWPSDSAMSFCFNSAVTSAPPANRESADAMAAPPINSPLGFVLEGRSRDNSAPNCCLRIGVSIRRYDASVRITVGIIARTNSWGRCELPATLRMI